MRPRTGGARVCGCTSGGGSCPTAWPTRSCEPCETTRRSCPSPRRPSCSGGSAGSRRGWAGRWRSETSPADPVADYRIDDLAREAGATVRNVRAYQDRGLLPPPRREGRVGIYTDAHLARLRLIGQLLERGYTLANIAELVDAWERGHGLGDLLGLGAALAEPFSDEAPARLT